MTTTLPMTTTIEPLCVEVPEDILDVYQRPLDDSTVEEALRCFFTGNNELLAAEIAVSALVDEIIVDLFCLRIFPWLNGVSQN